MRSARFRGTRPAMRAATTTHLDAFRAPSPAAAGSFVRQEVCVSTNRTNQESHMAKWMLLGLLMLLPWGNAARADDYDPNLCDAFEYNMNPPFDVPPHREYRLTIDMRHCGGF